MILALKIGLDSWFEQHVLQKVTEVGPLTNLFKLQ